MLSPSGYYLTYSLVTVVSPLPLSNSLIGQSLSLAEKDDKPYVISPEEFDENGYKTILASNALLFHHESSTRVQSKDYEDNDKFFKTSLYQPTSDEYWAEEMSNFINSNHRKVLLNHKNLDSPL